MAIYIPSTSEQASNSLLNHIKVPNNHKVHAFQHDSKICPLFLYPFNFQINCYASILKSTSDRLHSLFIYTKTNNISIVSYYFQFIIMRSASKDIHYQSWPQIYQSLQQLINEPYRFHQQIKNIILSSLGSTDYPGLIATRMPYYYQKSPLYWAREVDNIVRLFSRNGILMSKPVGLISRADSPVTIDPKILPKSVLAEFPALGDKSSTIMRSLRRQRGDLYFVDTWQWFWINIAFLLVNLPEIQQNRNFLEEENEDEMFYILSRNPLLLLLQKSLIEYRNEQEMQLWKRMRSIFEIFIIDELLFTLKKEQAQSELKYQLSTHKIATLFLLINSKRESDDNSYQKQYEFFEKVTQNFSKISQIRNNNLRNLLRTWIFLVTREDGVDQVLVKQLCNANPECGWYKLQRCPHQHWLQGIYETQITYKQIATVAAIRSNFYRIIKNHTEWAPGFSFLLVLQQFSEFDKFKLAALAKKLQSTQQNYTIRHAFEKNLYHMAQTGVDFHRLQQIQKRLNKNFVWRQPININFAERTEEAKQHLSKTSRENRNSLTYQNPRYRNVWQHPRQQNESEILLRATKWIASQIDKVIPGHSKRTNPCLNIRIFANIPVFLVITIILVVAIRWRLSDRQ